MKKFIACLLFIALLSGCGYSKFEYDGNSMLPTLKDKQIVLVDKGYYKSNSVHRGDIVVFKTNESGMYIKRVVGLPNDFLQIKDGTVFINHNAIDKKFIFEKVTGSDSLKAGIKLEKNQYFVLGDNAPNSLDSRQTGPISKDEIIGKVIGIKKSVQGN